MAQLIKTHILGFDEQLGGGIPEGSVCLLVGEPGTMKSSVAYNMLYHNALSDDRKGLYISLEQGRDSLLSHMSGLGMDHSVVEDRLTVLDLALIRKNLTMLGDHSWLHVFKMYADNLKKSQDYTLLVLDSLPVLELLANFEKPRIELFHFFEWLRDHNTTTFLIQEQERGSQLFGKYDEDFLSDAILHLRMAVLDDINVQRRLRAVKVRNAHHSPNYFQLLFQDGRFQVTKVIEDKKMFS